MSKLMPSDITDEVLDVLRNTANGKGESPCFLTSYQILARLQVAVRQRLHNERGNAGQGGGQYYGPATVVAKACEMLESRGLARIEYWDTRGATFAIDGQDDAPPSFEVCAMFQAILEQ